MAIDALSTQRWGEVTSSREEDSPLAEAINLLDDQVSAPYQVNEELNFRIALWQGDPTALQVDALVSSNDANLNERSGISGSLFATAGPQMEEACARLGSCSPGDAKATRGFRLPAKHVVHTVPPSRSDGFDDEAVLERCYASSFSAALLLGCKTVAFTCIKSIDTPREQAAHVALRAVRQLLEQPSARTIQLVLFAMRPQDVYDAMVYQSLFPLYFPRSASEEHEAVRLLPPLQQLIAPLNGDGSGSYASAADNKSWSGIGDFAAQSHIISRTSTIGCEPNPAFAGIVQPLRNDGGREHGGGVAVAAAGFEHATMCAASRNELRGSAYAFILQRAGLADLSDIEAMQLFYRGGVDARGRPVFLFWAGHLPSRPVDLERVIMHVMRTLDAHVHSGYNVVYIHTVLSPENEPPFAWLRKVHDVCDQRLKESLHLVYIVHASWWLKMAMNFIRAFVASGRSWESKIIQLPYLADLFKQNYFAPGSLRMPDSPLVRKYLEMSNDGQMLEAITGEELIISGDRAAAIASVACIGGIGSGTDSLQLTAAERRVAATSADRDGNGAALHLKASKDVILQQLIELSDQLAQVPCESCSVSCGDEECRIIPVRKCLRVVDALTQSRAHSDAAQQRQGRVQAMKDEEINRLSDALSDAQRDADDARRRLGQVRQQSEAAQSQRHCRQEILAELADLERQLAQTQVYNHHMANEMLGLSKQLQDEKWALLLDISSLERQLEATKAARFLGPDYRKLAAGGPPDGQCAIHAAKSSIKYVDMISRLEEVASLHAELMRGRKELECATHVLQGEHGEFQLALLRAAEEAASVRGVKDVYLASSGERHRELQSIAGTLEQKIAAMRNVAYVGNHSAGESVTAKSTEVGELEAIIAAAAEDIDRIEQHLSQQSASALATTQLQELRATLSARLIELDGLDLERLLGELATRRDSAMRAVAQQLVPQLNEIKQAHAVKRYRLLARMHSGAAEEHALMQADIGMHDRAHDAQLAALEAKAAEALASLEANFDAEVKRCDERARLLTTERQRIAAKLELIDARLWASAALQMTTAGETSVVADWRLAMVGHQINTDVSAVPLTRRRSAQRLTVFFREAADQAMLRALSTWRLVASYLAGLAAGSAASGSGTTWVKARAYKVALVRQVDEQNQQESIVAAGQDPAEIMDSVEADIPTLRRALHSARAEIDDLIQQRAELMDQLHIARAAAQRLADKASHSDGNPLKLPALRLIAELDCAFVHLRSMPAGNVTPVDSTRTKRVSRDYSVEADSTGALASCSTVHLRTVLDEKRSLEQRQDSVEAILAVRNDALAAAEDALNVAERHLEYLHGSANLAQIIEAQRARDDAKEARESVDLALQNALSELQTLRQTLESVRSRHAALRRQAQAVILEKQAQSLTDLDLLQVVVEVLQERLRETEPRVAILTCDVEGTPSCSKEPCCAPSIVELNAQCEHALAEFRLEFGAIY